MDLGDDHRSVRADAVRPDGRGVLDLGARTRSRSPSASTARWARSDDAALRRGARGGGRHARLRPIRTPACPTSSASTRRGPEEIGRAYCGELAEARPGQRRRRLLRNDAGAHPRDRRGGRGHPAARACPTSRRRCACPGLEPLAAHRRTIHASSTSASARTSPARPSSASLIMAGDYDAALAVARSRSRSVRRSSTSTWTRACSTASRR